MAHNRGVDEGLFFLFLFGERMSVVVNGDEMEVDLRMEFVVTVG